MTDTDELAVRLEKIRHCIGQKCGPERSEAAAALRTLQAERNEARATTAVVRAIKDQAFEKLDAAEATIAQQAQEIAALREDVKRVQSDREYIIGWNDGWDEAIDQNLRFPTMLRMMWSGDKVQSWIDEQMAEARRARSLANTKGSEDDR